MLAKTVIKDPVEETPGALEIGFEKERYRNCSAILFDNLERNPDKLAITGPLGSLTYRELCGKAAQWGNALAHVGLRRGERIAFFLDDTPVYPSAFFGAVRAGFVPVLLNTLTTPDTLNYFLKDTGARVAICESGFADQFNAMTMKDTALEHVVVANGTGEIDEGFVHAADFLAGMNEELACANTGPDDMAFWMYSSGSTGRPKGIVHLHHDMAYTELSFGRNVLRLREDDICFSVPKVFFAYGFGNAFTFPFSVGATTVLMPGRPDPQSVVSTIEAFRPTVLFGLPTLYTAICHMADVKERDFSSLRQCMSAAEILSEDIFTAWEKLTGVKPIEGLGSTEVLHIYLSNSVEEQRLSSAGKRVPGYEVELRDGDGNLCAVGEEGVMWVRGTSSAPFYWNRPDKTSETMREDWVYTGDRFLEEDGYYFFQGRADDLIKVSGQWVWPMEVERCLNDHPHVRECAVLPYQLEDKRMSLRAFVSLREGQAKDAAQAKALQGYVKTELLPFKYPRFVEFMEELPKTGTGKIDRQVLAALPAHDAAN